ncbi:hypothetical protein [Bartonella sp. HY038]|uniref:hypothetical protein n=1 Tax=Bartonella sp. HY038 TaxID=2759660 RepID=UPI0015F7A79D|nr:hypothetical protein [Bartonella sp. HY038]
MHAVKQAFSQYQPCRKREDYCDTCVSDEMLTQIIDSIDNADCADNLACRLFVCEPIDCVGGINSFKFWLPRILEKLILDDRAGSTFEFYEKLACENVSFWRQCEQDALRQLFCRCLINFIAHNNPAPLGPAIGQFKTNDYTTMSPIAFSLKTIIACLIHLRVAPREIFNYLFQQRDERIDYYFADFIDDPLSAWWLLNPDKDAITQRHGLFDTHIALIYLHQLAHHSFFEIISKPYLEQQLMKYKTDGNSLLYKNLTYALELYDETSSSIPLISKKDGEEAMLKLLAEN